MKALILAAGQGTRLKQLTARRPKPMLPLQGRPVLAHTLQWLAAHGVTRVAINLHHHSQMIVDHFGDGAQYGVSITYSHEEKLLGTAGAAKRLAAYLTEPFVVVYGDVVTNLNLTRLVAFHRRAQERERSAITLALYQVPDPTQCGLVETDASGRIRRFVEKPPADHVFTDLAFSGVMICEPSIFPYIPDHTAFDFGHDLIPRLLAAHVPMYALPVSAGESVIDMGTLSGYLAALHAAGPRRPMGAVYGHAY